jgi:hypothetical protein
VFVVITCVVASYFASLLLLIGFGCVLSCGWTAVHVDTCVDHGVRYYLLKVVLMWLGNIEIILTYICVFSCVLAVGDISVVFAVACIGGECYVGVVLSSALLY